MTCKSVTLTIVALLVAGPACAEIYKCTDAQGATQYSDKPCSNTATVITPRSGPQADTGADDRMEKTRRLLRAYEEERAQERREAGKKQAEKEQRTKNCANARNRYRQITRASRVYRYDEQGNQVNYSDAERERATADAREAVARWCD